MHFHLVLHAKKKRGRGRGLKTCKIAYTINGTPLARSNYKMQNIITYSLHDLQRSTHQLFPKHISDEKQLSPIGSTIVS